jgi:hypothetical protein
MSFAEQASAIVRDLAEIFGRLVAQTQRRLHFGLGADPTVEKVTIRWPSGKITEIAAPATGRVHAIKEP